MFMRRVVDEKKRFRLPMVISSVVWFWFVGAVGVLLTERDLEKGAL
jgi:hypothetical protein